MLTPIMLRSFGRSGSTLMMQVLGSSNNVLFDRIYPFENRYLTYLHRVAYIISKPFGNDELWNPDALLRRDVSRIGPIPFKKSNIVNKKNLSTAMFRKLWNGFSVHVKNNSKVVLDESKPVYYAEKVAHDICENVNKIVPARNLFLFRDPRDEFLSIKSFNEKRGYKGFGWDENDTDESFALKLCRSRRGFMRNLANMKNDSRRYVVLYENFLQSPFEETEKLGDWIGLDLDYQYVLDQKNTMCHHFTSNNSIFRWRDEMPLQMKNIFTSELTEELLALGYNV